MFDPEGVAIVGRTLEEGSSVHGDAADPVPPRIFTNIGILQHRLLGSLIFAGTWILISQIIVHRVFNAFLIDLIDKVLAVLASNPLHSHIAATFIEVLFLSVGTGGRIRRKVNIIGHVLIKGHAFGEAALALSPKHL